MRLRFKQNACSGIRDAFKRKRTVCSALQSQLHDPVADMLHHRQVMGDEEEIPIPDYVFEAILEQREIYEQQKRRRSSTFQDLGYICCSSYGRPRSSSFHWQHYKKLLADNNLPNIRWHDLRSTFCTLLLKNDFNPKAVSKLMGHAKELITMDVYGDNRGILADCVDELQPFIEEVLPNAEQDNVHVTERMDVVINAKSYLS